MPNRHKPSLTPHQRKYIIKHSPNTFISVIANDLDVPYYKVWRYINEFRLDYITQRKESKIEFV